MGGESGLGKLLADQKHRLQRPLLPSPLNAAFFWYCRRLRVTPQASLPAKAYVLELISWLCNRAANLRGSARPSSHARWAPTADPVREHFARRALMHDAHYAHSRPCAAGRRCAPVHLLRQPKTLWPARDKKQPGEQAQSNTKAGPPCRRLCRSEEPAEHTSRRWDESFWQGALLETWRHTRAHEASRSHGVRLVCACLKLSPVQKSQSSEAFA